MHSHILSILNISNSETGSLILSDDHMPSLANQQMHRSAGTPVALVDWGELRSMSISTHLRMHSKGDETHGILEKNLDFGSGSSEKLQVAPAMGLLQKAPFRRLRHSFEKRFAVGRFPSKILGNLPLRPKLQLTLPICAPLAQATSSFCN